MRVHKVLCVCLKRALLFYEKLVGDLESHGSEIDTYDPRVANKTVYGDPLTIMWYVEDLKISHVDKKVILSTILWLESVYSKMHGTCGE